LARPGCGFNDAIRDEERVNARTGAILLWPLLAIGLLSLLWWRWSDDLRLYFWAQFFPFLALVLLFLLYPLRYTGTYLLDYRCGTLRARQVV
jgi:hypothetical protein